MKTIYDDGFYDVIRDGAQRSAASVVPVVIRELGSLPARVIDVGCGEGWWAAEFARFGLEVIGVDGAYAADSNVLGDRFIAHDLELPLPLHLAGRFDLAVSLEVAEHLHPRHATRFVSDLTKLAPIVLFSAAVPGQGGTHHVNEQWPAYWVELFERHGWSVSGALRWLIWSDETVENWYRQNLLLAVSPIARPTLEHLFTGPTTAPFAIVHPVLYDARRR